MQKNLLTKDIYIPEEHDRLIKDCMKNHIVLYNHALQLLHKNNYESVKMLQKAVKSFIDEHNIFPIVKTSIFIEIYYLYKKFRRGIRAQKNITNIQYMTFIINDLQRANIKINTTATTTVKLKIKDFLTNKEFAELNNKVRFINFSYSNVNNTYVLAAFG